MKKLDSGNVKHLLSGFSVATFTSVSSLRSTFKTRLRNLLLLVVMVLPVAVSATLILPAIPSNEYLAKRFERSTEMAFRVKVGTTFLPSGALIAYINGEIRGAQTASVLFPPTGDLIYKVLVFNDNVSGDSISFKYYDIFAEKIYEIKEKIEFKPDLVPDYANPIILTAYCKPVDKVTGMVPATAADNQNSILDLYWQPSPNTSYYNLFLWETGGSVPTTPYLSNLNATTARIYNLGFGKSYSWKIVSVNDCSTAESTVQTFKIRQLPDITITNITAPATVESGSNFTINFKVKNVGLGSTFSAQWNDAVYISTDATFSIDDKLLNTQPNQGQLAKDSSYSQSIVVSLPNEYSGIYYLFVKTDNGNSLTEISKDNNTVKSVGTLTVALKALPDVLVKNIQAGSASVKPGDSLLISWQVEDAGNVAATGGWMERITLVPSTGLRLLLEPNITYSSDLAAHATVNRSIKFKIPEIVKFSGSAKIEVDLVPSATLVEHPGDITNNLAISAGSINMVNVLSLNIQTSVLLESSPQQVRCILSRSGDFTNALNVDLSASMSGQITIPASVTIPGNNSSVVFNISAINNNKLDGPRDVLITSKAAGYIDAVDTIHILDDEIPALTLQLDKVSITEGQTSQLTISRDFVSAQPLTVNLSTNKSVQWTFPQTVIIPASQASAVVTVAVTDDQIPEINSVAIISASSAGYTSGQVAATIVDNDVPQVKFEILTDTVSEGAGIYATWGRISRVTGTDDITINLSGNPSDALFFPQGVTLPKGTSETKFNIGVVDNNQVDGFRTVTIKGSVFISSCNCNTTADNGGVVQAKLVIADNDGPTLTASVDPVSLPEGKTAAGKLIITRNTSTDQPLAVNIRFSDATKVVIQPTATIPAGQKSVQVPITTINNNIPDGDVMVTLQVDAPLFSPGFCYVFVTDQNKADLSLRPIVLSLDSAKVGALLEIRGTMRNTGLLNAPAGVKINFYLSKDDVVDNFDQVLGQFETVGPLAMGDSVNFVKGFVLPNSTGNFKVIAEANPGNTINELIYTNNTSVPVPFSVLPEYSATAVVDQDYVLPNTPVTIHGSAYLAANQPAANVDVDVYILNNGTRRELKAKTNVQGTFSVNFTPVINETGHFTVGACYPKQNLKVDQDAFDILGMQKDPAGNIIWETKLGQTFTGVVGIKNSSLTSLHHVVISASNLPAGCQLSFDSIPVLSGAETKQFSFTLKPTQLTAGKDYEKINLNVSSAEGVSIQFVAFYYCQALQGQLKTDPVSINTTITKGKSRLYELSVYNNGAGETGLVTVSLPDVSFMSLVSPATIPNIAPKDTATVILQMSPSADMPLNTPVSGNIAINCVNGIGLVVPYRIEAVSQEKGSLKVDVVDEYTYFTEAKPHVKNAHVVVRHPFSGVIIAEGFTDSTGVFRADSLAEGSYKMTIEVEKHEGYLNTIIIDPGRVNEQSIFLSFQAISYTWEVVPTQIQDNYQVDLVMKYETNVPVPVVIMEMPKDMPKLVNNETFPFLITLTNKGLITAKDVQINLPQNDPEYEFVTNFTKLDLLAQQAIQVPVVMKRKDAPKSATSVEDSGPCTDFVFTVYGWECGKDKHWNQTNYGITFSGRVCLGSGTDGWGGWGGWSYSGDPSRGGSGPTYYDPYNSTPSISSPSTGCSNCAIDLALALGGCLPVAGPAFNTVGCMKTLVGFSGMSIEFGFDVLVCILGYVPVIGCPVGLIGAAKSCFKEFFLKSPYYIDAGGTETIPPIIKQALSDMQRFVDKHDALVGYMTEFMGGMDWQIKESFPDFLATLDTNSTVNKAIDLQQAAKIKAKMLGRDISATEIDAFISRWNNTVAAYALGIYSPTPEHPGIIDNHVLEGYVAKEDSVQNYAVKRGYASVGEMYNAALATVKQEVEDSRSSVCSSVTIKISQKLVMTREAFEGTLTIYNGNKTTAMKEVKLNLEIKDENGIIANDLFQIDTKSLDILTGIDGTGQLGPDQKGSATVLFIPEKGAAPTVPKSYSFGGTFSYLDPFTGVTVTKPLFPVTLEVHPSPDLYLHYFMQRDILGDDPLTAAVEPIIPGELAVMIQNNGYGTANSVRIESAQPKIVENQKGLAVNFALIASNLNGQPKQLGLTNIDFGNIAPKSAAIGQWWFTCDLLGHFVSYDAKVTHLDSRGNPDLSLISGATMHELIRSIDAYGTSEDGIEDFLVNEVQDVKETPDALYLSNGGVLDVYPASAMSVTGPISAPGFETDLLVTPSQIGWNYQKMTDPGVGLYKLVSVTREDGQIIPLKNVWQTYVTLPDGKEPVYENMLHFTDVFKSASPVKYRIKYAPKDQAVPAIVRIDTVPDKFVSKPVQSLTVVFSKPINPATFTYEDMSLRVQGGAELMDASVTVTKIDSVTFKVNFASKTLADGYYVLNVQTAAISDLAGTFGEVGKQATWTQFAHIPFIDEFTGVPPSDSAVKEIPDFILVHFNVPVDPSTLWPERFSWKKNGNAVPGTVTITSMDIDGKLFKLSGLKEFLAGDGKYTMSVDLPNITSLEGISGAIAQTVEWTIDNTPPVISKIILNRTGGFDSQHVTAIEIQFNEPVSGFGVSSLELWKDGQRQPLSQLDIQQISGSDYLFTQFRLLTYYDGNYILKVKLNGISDISGNTASGTIEHKWLVFRKTPKAVTGLKITPDLGFSNTDAITSEKTVSAIMTVNEPASRIQIIQNDHGNLTILADVPNSKTGLLTVPVQFTLTGNLVLEAHCLDSLTNEAVTSLPVYIDEAALQANWTNIPALTQSEQPDSIVLEFSDKLLDDSSLKNYLKFERGGQVIAVDKITISKKTDKIYVLKGLNQAGNSGGSYALSVDLTKLQKYSSGKPGLTAPKAQWSIVKPNQAPVAVAGPDQTVNEGALVTLDASQSSDPDNDLLTYTWTAPPGIVFNSATIAKPQFYAPYAIGETNYTMFLVVNDGQANSAPVSVTVKVLESSNVGIPVDKTSVFRVYPNPATGIITVEIPNNTGKNSMVSVYNITGSEIMRKDVSSSTKFQVDLSNQVSGVYLLRISGNDQNLNQKIILQRP